MSSEPREGPEIESEDRMVSFTVCELNLTHQMESTEMA